MIKDLTYYDIVKGADGDEDMMWEGVKRVSELVDELKETNPEKAAEFLEQEYLAMNGKHFNETLAKVTVADMWHKDPNGNTVKGEAVTPQDAQTLLTGKTDEYAKKHYWDAYVAANGFMHDLGKAGLPKSEIMSAAKAFWFNDDDREDPSHKVAWYYLGL